MSRLLQLKKAIIAGGVGLSTLGAYYISSNPIFASSEDKFAAIHEPFESTPSREQHIETLKKKKDFDVLIIGGGATGTGAALVRISIIESFRSKTNTKEYAKRCLQQTEVHGSFKIGTKFDYGSAERWRDHH
jgi:hypothetical protein